MGSVDSRSKPWWQMFLLTTSTSAIEFPEGNFTWTGYRRSKRRNLRSGRVPIFNTSPDEIGRISIFDPALPRQWEIEVEAVENECNSIHGIGVYLSGGMFYTMSALSDVSSRALLECTTEGEGGQIVRATWSQPARGSIPTIDPWDRLHRFQLTQHDDRHEQHQLK